MFVMVDYERILTIARDEEGISHVLEDAIAGDNKKPAVTYLHQRWHSFVHAAPHSRHKTFVIRVVRIMARGRGSGVRGLRFKVSCRITSPRSIAENRKTENNANRVSTF